jgi:anti-anti-sigma regulatory factor
MEMEVEQRQGAEGYLRPVTVTVLKLRGNVDGSNYQQVIQKGDELFKTGTRNLLLDLSEVPFLSSAGLVALHRLSLTLRGNSDPEPESGWQALGDISKDVDQGFQANLKLLNPQPRVMKALDMAGFSNFLEIFQDADAAIAAFKG